MSGRVLIALLLASVPGAGAGFAGESLEEQLAELLARHEQGASDPKDFEIDEEEANRFLREHGETELPAGVESPWIRFDESLAVLGATLDLAEVKDALPAGGLLQLLSGKVPVEITARISGEAGVGKLVLEKVLLAGIELPVSFVETLAGDANDIPFLPGFRLGEPFPLPFGVESVRSQAGHVTVRQSATANK